MELLTEFVHLAASVAINIALLTEGEKSKQPMRNSYA